VLASIAGTPGAVCNPTESIAVLDLRPGRTASWTYRRAMGAVRNGLYLTAAGPFSGAAVDLSKTHTVLSLGAPVLDGWGTPGRVLQARKSFRLIQAETRQSRTALLADGWLPIRPGTEAALALGIANVLIGEKLHDAGAARNASDFAAYAAMAAQFPPQRAAQLTGIPAGTIVAAAHDFVGHGPAVAIAAGVSRPMVTRGVAEVRNGASADGRVRRPGGGRKPLTETDPGLLATNFDNALDAVNNVENIVIPAPLVKNYAVIVKAKRVNVNAVTAHTNDIVQDFALVITTASTNPAAVTVSSTTFATNKTPWVAVISNSVPLLGQRVGANSPLIGGTNGTTNQWRFYAFTNQPVLTADGTNAAVTNGQPYVAIVTFMPLNLASTPRSSEPDIDLYVSTNSDLTNLVPAIINASDKSTRRGGIESVIYTNSITNTVYYIGVKSEDQKASEFGLLAVASDSPFDSDDGNFTRSRGRPLPLIIPDGWVGGPSNGIILNLSLTAGTRTIRQLMVEERLLSSFRPDIYSLLQSEGGSGAFCWVNNHTDYGSNTVTFDDSGSQWVENSITSDGPGSLRSFMGSTVPPFFLTRFWDNAAGDIAQVNDYDLLLGFQPIDPYDFTVDLRPNGWYYDFLDLPSDVTNLNIKVYLTNGGPVQIFLKKGDFPTLTDYDFANLNVMPPGGELNVSINDTPPISGGRWYYGFYNPTTSEEIFRVRITVSRSLTPDLTMTYTNSAGTNLNLLPDDALTNTAIYVPASNTVVAASVGVRLDHSRLSDLAITLTSPQGTRVLIFEDRGGTNATALGLSLTNDVATNRVYTWFTEDTNLNPILIKFAVPPYASTNDSLMTNRVVFASYFDTNWFWDYQDTSTWPSRVSLGLPPVGVFTNGQYVDGWFVETNRMETNIVVSNGLSLVVVTNVALTNNSVCVVKDIAHSPDGSNNFLTLGSGRLIRAVLVEAGRSYRLTFLSRSQGLTNWWPADNKANDLVGGVIGTVSSSGVAYDAGLVDGSWRLTAAAAILTWGRTLATSEPAISQSTTGSRPSI